MYLYMEIINKINGDRPSLKVALFDFDGTISTLRQGWEDIMEPMMLEMISGNGTVEDSLVDEVKQYIDQSTGIQTIYQMQWLADTVKRYGRNKSASDDPWWYKREYNRRLMKLVTDRKSSILSGEKSPEDYLIEGSKRFLQVLKQNGIEIYIASGTDHTDVVEEAQVLGLSTYLKEIAGAPPNKYDCSKEAVLRKLAKDSGLKGQELIVVGDGKVEIALGLEVGALTLGVASDEERREGINEIKRKRLVKAGADAIVGDYNNLDQILDWLGIA